MGAMNILILSTSLGWTIAMSLLLLFNNSLLTKIVAYTIITINVLTTVYHLVAENHKKSLELRIYADNLIVLLLIVRFPHDFFYGFSIQISLSIIIAHLYLKNKARVYKILILLIITEIAVYLPICSLKVSCNFIYNTVSMLLILSVLLVVKNRLLLCPEDKYKKIIMGANNIIRHEIIECISPMQYYIRDLDEDKKEKMTRLINKLNYVAQNTTNNFGYIISLIKSTLHNISNKDFNISLVDQTTKIIEFDSYILLIIMYVIVDCSIYNQASEIVVKFNNKEIEVTDNGYGHDLNSKQFEDSILKKAIDLIKLYDFSVKVTSVINAGTTIKILL